jgi:hypothetical protein
VRKYHNEIAGCRIWRLNSVSKLVLTLGDGTPSFQSGTVDFDKAKISRVYDIRRGPEDNIYVLDSGNFVVRKIDFRRELINGLAGTERTVYEATMETRRMRSRQ